MVQMILYMCEAGSDPWPHMNPKHFQVSLYKINRLSNHFNIEGQGMCIHYDYKQNEF